MIDNFEEAAALDSIRAEYLLHWQIHAWLAESKVNSLDELNERVYAELFLTPSSDPWLGLVPADTYTGLGAGARRSSRNRVVGNRLMHPCRCRGLASVERVEWPGVGSRDREFLKSSGKQPRWWGYKSFDLDNLGWAMVAHCQCF